MAVLNDFQTNATRNDLYRSRLDYLRVQKTVATSMAQALAEKEQALAREERALAREERAQAREERAQAEKERALAQEAKLRERLRAAGIDPDEA